MNQFVLVCNSTIDETAEYFETNDIKCAPLSFTIDARTIVDDLGKTLPYHDFYQMLRAGKTAITSQATPATYLNLFREACESGRDVLYVGFSSGLSGSFEAGRLAATEVLSEFPERVIRCVDSLCAAGGERILVDKARAFRDAGMSVNDAGDALEEMRRYIIHLITVDDLKHLWRGGRVSRSAAVFGTLAGVKPIIFVDNEGKLNVCHKVRGRRASLEYLGDKLLSEIEYKDQICRISHGDCEADAQYLADYLAQKAGIQTEIRVLDTVLGSHTGPGVVTLFYIGKERAPF